MRINGSVHIAQDQQLRCWLSYSPLGVTGGERPNRVFKDRREVELFLADALRVDFREIRSMREALVRHGRYTIAGVWLADSDIVRLGLGPVWFASSVPGALVSGAAA